MRNICYGARLCGLGGLQQLSSRKIFMSFLHKPTHNLFGEGVNPYERQPQNFLKVTTLGGVAYLLLASNLAPSNAQLRELKIARASDTRATCPYCFA